MREIINNLVAISISDLINRGIFLFFNIVVARSLAPTDFGIYSLALSFGFYILMVCDGGVTAHSTKQIATSDREKWPEIIGNAIATREVFTLILLIITGLGMLLTSIPFHEGMVYLLVFLYPVGMGLFPAWISRGLGDNAGYFYSYSYVSICAFVTLSIFMILPEKDSYHAILWRSMAWLVGAIYALYWVCSRHKIKINLSYIRVDLSVLKKIYPLGIATILYSLLPMIPLIFMRAQSMLEELAIYGATWQIVQILITGGAVFSASLLPTISKVLATRNLIQLRLSLTHHFILLLVAAFCVAFFFKVLGSFFVGFLYGDFYAQPKELVAIFSILLFVKYLRLSIDAILISLEKYGFMSATGVVSILVVCVISATSDNFSELAESYLIGEICLLLANFCKVFSSVLEHYHSTTEEPS